MLIGCGVFALDDLGVFQTNNSIGTIESVKLENGIYDELHIQNTISETFTTNLDNWTSSTILLAKFKNNLSAGNINLNGLVIENLLIKKRKVNTLTWEDVATLPFIEAISFYTHTDKFVEGNEEYEYAIIPATKTILGDYSVGEIDVNFDSGFIFDKDFNYKLLFNFELGDFNYNSPNSTVELLGAKYPIILYSAETQYKSSSLKAMLVSDVTYNTGGNIDAKAEKLYRKSLMDFLTNKKPKILKDSGGSYTLISIIGTPRLTPHNELGALIYDLSFDFVEVGDATDNATLVLAGIK